MSDLPQNWRHTDPITSREAGEGVDTLRRNHHARILAAMTQVPRPVSAEEIGNLLAWPNYHPIGRRLHELVKLGLVERTEERHTNRSGRSAFRYRLVKSA